MACNVKSMLLIEHKKKEIQDQLLSTVLNKQAFEMVFRGLFTVIVAFDIVFKWLIVLSRNFLKQGSSSLFCILAISDH